LYGLRTEAPDKETQKAVAAEPLTVAERLRIIYQIITNSPEEGGAGITPKSGEWKYVESIFALHDNEFNRKWIKELSQSTMLKPEQLDEIRNHFGERIAFYFAFIQSYFAFLTALATIGFSAWFFLGHFSPIYAVVNGLWCVAFTEWWKHQEVDLAIRWGVKGVSKMEGKNRDFKQMKFIQDPITGEKVGYFPSSSRLQRQLLVIPFALVTAGLLGCLISMCFGIEVFISEVYSGPLKSVLVYLPTGILTTTMPILGGVLRSTARKLTNYENYETQTSHRTALSHKLFVMDFVTDYLGILLTAFVYVPFGKVIVPYLDVFHLTVKPFTEDDKHLLPQTSFQINPDRLRKQVIYFTVTAQVVNFLLELVVPYLQRKGFAKFKQIKSDYAAQHGGSAPSAAENDSPEEAAFLARVRKESELSVYDVEVDIREMVIQYGYLSLFSVVWPLVPVSFLINNWIEIRGDAVKIAIEMQRPVPDRDDTIGPWLDSLGFLTWFGSLTTAALVFLFSNDGIGPGGDPYEIKAWALILTVFLSEQSYLIVRWATRMVISRIQSPGLVQDRRERYMVRKRYVEQSFKDLPLAKTISFDDSEPKIDRASLEDAAREGSMTTSSAEDRFWLRQRGWRETAQVGSSLIQKTAPAAPAESKKEL
jgi:anoctamin-10